MELSTIIPKQRKFSDCDLRELFGDEWNLTIQEASHPIILMAEMVCGCSRINQKSKHPEQAKQFRGGARFSSISMISLVLHLNMVNYPYQ